MMSINCTFSATLPARFLMCRNGYSRAAKLSVQQSAKIIMPAQQVHFIINRSSRYRLLHILANVLTALLPVFPDHGKCDGADGQLAGEELQDRSKIRRSRAIVSSQLLATFQLK